MARKKVNVISDTIVYNSYSWEGNSHRMSRLLIVYHEPAVRSLLSVAFVSAGYEVRTAADPFEAMELCTSQSFDAILSDVHVPRPEGDSLARLVAGKCPKVRSVLMSARAIDCGDCPFKGQCQLIQKPFVPKTAVGAVTQVLLAWAA